jgi:hypothetical protein
MRINGGVVTWHAQSIMEIAPPTAARAAMARGLQLYNMGG